MASNFISLDKWRAYFRSSNSDIFDIIEHAVMVAAADCPYDFRMKRDRIAELLFSCKSTKCFGCDKIELALPNGDGLTRSEEKSKSVIETGGSKDTKESKVNDDDDDHREMMMTANVDPVSNYSYGVAEALTDEIEEEYQFHWEVLRIKQILDNCQQESDSLLFDSLRRLRLMPLNVEILKATEIGKSVNALRKHGLKEIRGLAKALVEDWKVMVDAWATSTPSIAGEVRTESVKTSAVEDVEGLPSPPMDEGAFFATPTSMDLSKFFDGIDDDGNLQENQTARKSKNSAHYSLPKDTKPEPTRNLDSMKKQPTRPTAGAVRPKPSTESVPDRQKPVSKSKVANVTNVQRDHEKMALQKAMLKPARDDLGSVVMKLEAAKRKLHERYQQAENAKKQRTIQVVELHDLPKQSLVQRNQQTKPGNHRRQWTGASNTTRR